MGRSFQEKSGFYLPMSVVLRFGGKKGCLRWRICDSVGRKDVCAGGFARVIAADSSTMWEGKQRICTPVTGGFSEAAAEGCM